MGTQATATQSPATGPAGGARQFRTNPYLGIAGVFCGAGIATLNARLVGVGLPDLRGALGLGFDEASWIPTALNMATMFSGVFVCFLSIIYGPRRILLQAAAVFALISAILPFVSGYTPLLVLVALAGLSSGTFYSLTMTFVISALPKKLIIFGVAAYAADIVFVSNIASLLEGWFIETLSWRWIFWTAAVVTPLMMLFVYFGIPRHASDGARPEIGGASRISAAAWPFCTARWTRGEARLAALRSHYGNDRRGSIFGPGRDCQADCPSELDRQSFIPQPSEHDHSLALYLLLQVFASCHDRADPGFPGQYRGVHTDSNGYRPGLGSHPDVRGCLAGRSAGPACEFASHAGIGIRGRGPRELALRTPRYVVEGNQL